MGDGGPWFSFEECAVGAQARDPKNQGSPERRSSLEEAPVSTGQVDSADRPLAQKDVGWRHLPPHAPLLAGTPQMRAIMRIVENVSDTDATVLTRGQSGVVKDPVARSTHARS